MQIKRSHPPRLASLGNEVDLEDVVASEVADFTNVTFAGDLSIQLIREERNAYDRRLTAISTLYERTLPEQNRKGGVVVSYSSLMNTNSSSLPCLWSQVRV